MADSGDRAMDLADKLVAAMATAFPTVAIGDQTHEVTAEWKDSPQIALEAEALLQPLLWVVDWGEILETSGDINHEDIELLIVLQMKLQPDTQSATIRALSKLMNDIARLLRPIDEAYYLELDDGGAFCVKAERRPARNLKALADEGRHYAEMVTTWRRF